MTLQELEMLMTNLDAICQEYGVAVFYLFGSQAEGYDDLFSDVDIGVVLFEPPNDTDWWERWQRLAAVIEPLIAPKELDLVFLQCAPVLLQWQAISYGKLLYCADEEFRLNFEEKVIGEWLDFSEWFEHFQQEMVTGILEKHYNA